jgi:hypothetical protein
MLTNPNVEMVMVFLSAESAVAASTTVPNCDVSPVKAENIIVVADPWRLIESKYMPLVRTWTVLEALMGSYALPEKLAYVPAFLLIVTPYEVAESTAVACPCASRNTVRTSMAAKSRLDRVFHARKPVMNKIPTMVKIPKLTRTSARVNPFLQLAACSFKRKKLQDVVAYTSGFDGFCISSFMFQVLRCHPACETME